MNKNVHLICENYKKDLEKFLEYLNNYECKDINFKKKKLIKFRENKIKEIEVEIKECTLKLYKAIKKIDSIKKSNCTCIGKEHRYVLVSGEIMGNIKEEVVGISPYSLMPLVRTYSDRDDYFINTYKCVYCGNEKKIPEYLDCYRYVNKFVRELPETPDDCFSQSISEKVFSDEIQRVYKKYRFLTNYIDYLNYFIRYLANKNFFIRGYENYDDEKIWNREIETDLSIPTFKMYLKEMKKHPDYYYMELDKQVKPSMSMGFNRYSKIKSRRLEEDDEYKTKRSFTRYDYEQVMKRVAEASKKWW